ncbi:purine-nucleoside phosphorylase [Rhodoblastus acidophilus]|nr:purine-nucleoside phosphorylase [Rhodoblastus acidophilus]MCW2272737.1 purine-nucleoside phosphorylase [Rhodoblastus acidophilus]
MSKNAEQAAALLRTRGAVEPVDFAVLLGFGLGGFSEMLSGGVSVDYAELPGFVAVDEPGVTGRASIGAFEGANVFMLQGQPHFFGAGDPTCMMTPLLTAKALGAKYLLIFATAGSCKADLYPGNLMLVTDHIALFGLNPLIGLTGHDTIFSLHDAYDPRLQRRIKRAAAGAGVPLQEGVFLWATGPTFPTPSEARAARQMGADAIGFGVAPEIILARAIGLRAAGVVAASHIFSGLQASEPPSLAENQKHALAALVPMRRLLRAFMKTADTF